MTEQRYIEIITEAYGPRAYEVYEACMAHLEEGWSMSARQAKFFNDCINRTWKGDPTALKDMARELYDLTGYPQFRF